MLSIHRFGLYQYAVHFFFNTDRHNLLLHFIKPKCQPVMYNSVCIYGSNIIVSRCAPCIKFRTFLKEFFVLKAI